MRRVCATGALFLGMAVGCTGEPVDTDSDGSPVSPWAGTWTARLDAHAALESDWEVVPLCSSTLRFEVQTDGSFTVRDACIVLWGTDADTPLEFRMQGTFSDDGTHSATLESMGDPDTTGSFPQVEWSGVLPNDIARVDTRFEQTEQEPEDAFILWRVER